MTHHRFITRFDDKNILVKIGWDRARNGFFMFVTKETIDERKDGRMFDYLYSSLLDEKLLRGVTRCLEYFVDKLVSLNLELPNEVLEELYSDESDRKAHRSLFYWYEGDKLRRSSALNDVPIESSLFA